jgi:ethanolamine utilization protein EutQ (cupin superfamily)
MATLEKKSFNQPEQAHRYEKGKLEVVTVGGLTFERITTEPGWQWSKHVKPIAKTESCQKSHVHYLVSGRLHVRMDDGTEEEFGAGDIAVIPPGHDIWTVGDEPAVILDFSH